MKKLSLFFICALISGIVLSQEIVLTFNPIGAATTIDSIKATNTETGESITIPGGELLELNAITTAINTVSIGHGNSIVYPNPFDSNTTLEFYSPKEDNISVVLINSLGQVVATSRQRITQGTHKFNISGKSAGMYYATIFSNSGRESHKMICTGNYANENKIEYVGFSGEVLKEKSFTIESAPLVHFEISSGDYRTVIADRPTESKTYDVEFMECKDDDDRDYKVVQIGEQWWMAENLAYLPGVNPPTEESNTEPRQYVYDYEGSTVVQAKASNYFKRDGVLYNWPASMVSCPKDWHLPTRCDWEEMAVFISNENGGYYKTEYPRHDWTGVGRHLKTTSGWNDNDNITGNGTDDYGFSGLPGGLFMLQESGNAFFGNGYSGVWWTSSEHVYNNDDKIVADWRSLSYLNLTFTGENTGNNKTMGNSVRCIRTNNTSVTIPIVTTNEVSEIFATSATCGGNLVDDGGAKSTLKGFCYNTTGNPTISDNAMWIHGCSGEFSEKIAGLQPNTTHYIKAYATNSSGTAYGEEKSFTTRETTKSIVSGTFIDSRDNHTYKWVKIGDQVWMAENLAYLPQVNRPENGDSYFRKFYYVYGYDGRDVNKAKALLNYHKYGVLYNGPATKDACPSGWHLSTLAEWNALVGYMGENGFSNNYGASLRAGAEWSNNGNGTDYFGFSALPAGYRTTPTYNPFTGDLITKGGFESIGDYGFWYTYNNAADKRTIQRLRYDSEYLFGYSMGERLGLSVRCVKNEGLESTFPTISTSEVTEVEINSAVCGGNITNNGDSEIITSGICWSKAEHPTIGHFNRTMDNVAMGEFSSNMTGLELNTTYYVRAYATNSEGTAYGEERSFTTTEITISIPTISTKEISDISSNSATSGGNITDDGGAEITARGICWNTGGTPTVSDSKTSDGTGIGEFTNIIAELKSNTTYYARAYATNSEGTAYGEEKSFITTTVISAPTVTTLAATNKTKSSAQLNGNVTSDGNATITQRGFYWSKTNNTPDAGDNLEIVSGTTGSYNKTISSLTENITYYYCAFATNSEGTATGDVIQFTTNEEQGGETGSFTDSRDNKTYKTVKIGEQWWMAENLAYLPSVSSPTGESYTEPYYYVYDYDGSDVSAAKAIDNYKTYGVLYNWPAAQLSCPSGWHLPSDTEWSTLTEYLGGEDIAGGKMKEIGTTHWNSPNTEATDESGFSGLPGGYRNYNGYFLNIIDNGYWWSATEYSTSHAWHRPLHYNTTYINRYHSDKGHGFSVRCVRD